MTPTFIPLTSLIPAGIGIYFYTLLLIFTVYGLFLGYHWFTFGESRHTSTIALAAYALGGAILFITLSSALNLISV